MAIAAYNSSVLLASQPSVAFTNEATTTSDQTTYTISNAAHRYFDKSVAVVTQKGNDELQTVTITGSPTGGTFTLTFGGQTTSAIAYNATAATVQAALQALSSIGSSNMLVSGSAGGPYLCQFTAGKGLTNQATMTFATAFTGGSSPSLTIVETQAGQAFTTVTTGFTLYRANARVTFAVAQAQGTQVRFASGNYFPYSTLAQAHTAEFAGKMSMLPTTVFGTAGGAETFIPGLLSGTLKYTGYWINNARMASLIARDYLIVSFQTPTGNRYEGFCYASDSSLKADTKSTVDEDLTFQLTDEFFNA